MPLILQLGAAMTAIGRIEREATPDPFRAVAVEKAYGRSIIVSLYGFWSLGGVVGVLSNWRDRIRLPLSTQTETVMTRRGSFL